MATIHELLAQVQDEALRAKLEEEVKKLSKQKKFGLVFEEHLPECTPLYGLKIRRGTTVACKEKINDTFTVLKVEGDVAVCKRKKGEELEEISLAELVPVAEFGEPIYPYLQPIDSVCNAPDSDLWHTLIEADNYHALQLLEYLYAGKVDCIYIDPPYNTGARDWKYNNDYVDGNDSYRHSKWLSMIQKRLKIAKRLLNPLDSVLIVTIDEKEYLHLGCLLEEMFPETSIQMVSSVINAKGVARDEFFRVNEYIFIIRFGEMTPNKLPLSKEWIGNVKTSTTEGVRWGSLMRSGSNSERKHSPGCFYPIFISSDKKHFCGAGLPLKPDEKPEEYIAPNGQIALFPIHDNGDEGVWQYSRERFLDIQSKGYARISTQTKSGLTVRYISEGWQKKVENGQIQVIGKAEDGSLIFDDSDYVKEFIPSNQWWIRTHDATEFGSKFLQSIIGKRFSYPKSLYAEHDTIRFFVASKPNALILDFFAGSGTTLHAVNLLNAEDGGHRRCIMVTNNEVSDAEAKEMKAKGLNPGDEEWEKLGIARYVTWPRTVCSIEGHDVNGNPLKGNYIGSEIPMADGFKSNAVFFKLGFLDKNAVALGRQFKEMLPTLWMKAGAKGTCPVLGSDDLPEYMILPENKFAVLIDEKSFADFEKQVLSNKRIETVYIITDSEFGYKSMISKLRDRNTYQLYRDYLDNFRINIAR